MKYVDAIIRLLTEFFTWMNKKEQKQDADTNQVNNNPKPPRPEQPAPKPNN